MLANFPPYACLYLTFSETSDSFLASLLQVEFTPTEIWNYILVIVDSTSIWFLLIAPYL